MPQVTIVMPCFNSEAYLDDAIKAVFNQSLTDFELILVDDCSTDGTIEIIAGWQRLQPNIIVLSLDKNIGPGRARNAGIRAANSNLIALLDSDDIWYKSKLETQIAVHKLTSCAFSCTAFKFGNKKVYKGKTDYQSLLKNNVVNTSSVMFDRSMVEVEFDSEYKSEDYVAWLRISKSVQIEYINQVLVERRVVEGLSSNKFAMAGRRWQIYRNVEGLSLARSVYYFVHYAFSGLLKYSVSR